MLASLPSFLVQCKVLVRATNTLTCTFHQTQAVKQARKDIDKNLKERSKLSSKPPEYLWNLQQEVFSLAAELAALGGHPHANGNA